ncbi:MAG: Pycsar system effector family protein, partial [Pseudomonadota bacterium]
AALLPAPGALAAVATILSLAVLVVCIAAIVPRFPAAGLRRALWREDRFSWPALAGGDYGPGEFARFMRTAEASQMVCSLARSNAACATILLGKYRLLRLAFALALVQFVLLGAVIGLG